MSSPVVPPLQQGDEAEQRAQRERAVEQSVCRVADAVEQKWGRLLDLLTKVDAALREAELLPPEETSHAATMRLARALPATDILARFASIVPWRERLASVADMDPVQFNTGLRKAAELLTDDETAYGHKLARYMYYFTSVVRDVLLSAAEVHSDTATAGSP